MFTVSIYPISPFRRNHGTKIKIDPYFHAKHWGFLPISIYATPSKGLPPVLHLIDQILEIGKKQVFELVDLLEKNKKSDDEGESRSVSSLFIV